MSRWIIAKGAIFTTRFFSQTIFTIVLFLATFQTIYTHHRKDTSILWFSFNCSSRQYRFYAPITKVDCKTRSTNYYRYTRMRNILAEAEALCSVLFKSSSGYLIAREFNISIFIILSVYWLMRKDRFYVMFSCIISFVSVVFFLFLRSHDVFENFKLDFARVCSRKFSIWVFCGSFFADGKRYYFHGKKI